MSDEQWQDRRSWQPPRGPVFRTVAWVILIAMALFILGMLAVVIWQ